MKKNAAGLKETIMRKNQTTRPIEGQERRKKTHLGWKANFIT